MSIASGAPQARDTYSGGRLRLARARRGLRQADLADLIGIGRAMVSHLEVGRRQPSPEVLERITRFIQEDSV